MVVPAGGGVWAREEGDAGERRVALFVWLCVALAVPIADPVCAKVWCANQPSRRCQDVQHVNI